MLSLFTSPIGLVLGVLAGLWVNAADPGRSRLLRYGLAALGLALLPATGVAVLLALQRAA